MHRDSLAFRLTVISVALALFLTGVAFVLTGTTDRMRVIGWILIVTGVAVLAVDGIYEALHRREEGISARIKHVESIVRDLLRMSAPSDEEIRRPVTLAVVFSIRNATEHPTTSTWPSVTVLRRSNRQWVDAPIDVRYRSMTYERGYAVPGGRNRVLEVPAMKDLGLHYNLIFRVPDDMLPQVLEGKLRVRVELDVVGAGPQALTAPVPPADTRLLTLPPADPRSTTAPESPPPSSPASSE